MLGLVFGVRLSDSSDRTDDGRWSLNPGGQEADVEGPRDTPQQRGRGLSHGNVAYMFRCQAIIYMCPI